MPMQKIISEKLKHAGGKTFWEVKPSETEDIGGVRYLRLPRQGVQHGFARLCLEGCRHACCGEEVELDNLERLPLARPSEERCTGQAPDGGAGG